MLSKVLLYTLSFSLVLSTTNTTTPITPTQTKDTFHIVINKDTFSLFLDISLSTKLLLIYISIIIGIILALALIYSFCKVPLKKGYSCRCCMRTKWFIKAIIFIIISPCVVLYYCMNAIFGCLDGFIPDTKLDDCKLDEPLEEKKKQKKDKFVELKEEDIEGQKK